MTQGRDLAAVLRRLATDEAFVAAVTEDPRTALAAYALSASDLSALALWMERSFEHGSHGARGVRDVFELDE